jgi:FMN-dependent oxidoreductase (nitrilotriacetate monooxygenase family)
MSRHEPFTLLAALAAVTTKIGLVATASTSFYEPFHVARFFASLDQISGGRSGWNLVTSSSTTEAANFGITLPPEEERYRRATEYAEVVKGLWDSWDAEAVVGNKASGLYIDPDKVHILDHHGPHYDVRGPLTLPRSLQGRPVIVQAGQSEAGRTLASAHADIVFSVERDLASARAFYADIKARAVAAGRSPDDIKILPGTMTIVGKTRGEAEDKFDRLQRLIPEDLGLTMLGRSIGVDLTQYPIDGPLPPFDTSHNVGHRKVIADYAAREGMTIRKVYQHLVGSRSHRVVIGTARDVVDALEEWFTGGACDGFNIMPATFPEGLDDFVRLCVPELQRRGLFRTAYEADTLRGNLGLKIPERDDR